MPQLLALKAAHPDAKLVVGNTEVGIEVKFKALEYPVIINPSRVEALKVRELSSTGITVGSGVTVNGLKDYITEVEP